MDQERNLTPSAAPSPRLYLLHELIKSAVVRVDEVEHQRKLSECRTRRSDRPPIKVLHCL